MRWESWMESPLFAGIGREELEALLEGLPWARRRYARGETVCEAGEAVKALGVVAAGSVHIESCDAWGGRSLLGAVSAGEIFAEAYACLGSEPLLVRVVAAEAAEVIFLDAQALLLQPRLQPGPAAGAEKCAPVPAHALHRAPNHPAAAHGLPFRAGGAARQPQLHRSLQPAGAGGLSGGGPQRPVRGNRQNVPGGFAACAAARLHPGKSAGMIPPHARAAFAAY